MASLVVLRESLKRASVRVLAAISVTAGAGIAWSTWWGWLLAAAAGAWLLFFELGRWWDWVRSGRDSRLVGPRLSGSARFRQPGVTAVVLLDCGPHRARVVRAVSFMTRRREPEVARLVSVAPAEVAHGLSLESADAVVAALEALGARARCAFSEHAT